VAVEGPSDVFKFSSSNRTSFIAPRKTRPQPLKVKPAEKKQEEDDSDQQKDETEKP